MDMTQHAFQAEVAQVLDLVIHSLYRNKEIFLRELISNASDALDKLRFRALTEPALAEGAEPEIRLVPDSKAGTLTIWDNGVGMTEAELVQNLGTVAHSGTKAFLAQLEKNDANPELIGQFGVGFYAAFLVADRVEVVSRAAGSDDAFVWVSDAGGTFTVEPSERESRGTSITLHLKDEAREYLEGFRLRSLVSRYSDFVAHPIKLAMELPEQDEEAEERLENEGGKTSGTHYEVINQRGALWERPVDEVTEEQHAEFYQHLTHDWEAPLAHTHFRIEGTQEFTGLLYIPSRPPFDLFDRDAKHGVRLFVRRVFIMDDAEELLPVWLRFVRGVVDSNDLPLNVSRDVLQDSSSARVIKKQLVKKVLDLIESIAADKPEDYEKLWAAFGRVLKEGLHYDGSSRDRLAKLLRFKTTKSEGALTSLEQYVERMQEGQKAIYYAVGASEALVSSSPHTEALRKRGIEVILFTDAVDQWAVEGLREFDDKPLVSVAHADLEADEDETEEEKSAAEERAKELAPLTQRFEEVLGDRVREVKISKRLADSPVCLVVPPGGLPSHIERMLRAHNESLPVVPRILEINPDHPVIAHLGAHSEDADTAELIELLYDQALLVEGSPVDDPAKFAVRMSKLMEKALG